MEENKNENPNKEIPAKDKKEKMEITNEKTIQNKKQETKKVKKKSKLRMGLVLLFLAIFVAISYISLRGSYLEYKELGDKFVEVFFTNLKFRYIIMGINFIILFLIIYVTNKGIKKGLKVFFEKENKQVPRLLNKSLALIISAIISAAISMIFTDKIILAISNTSFGIQDPIFNFDIAYYMLQKPVIEMFIMYFIAIVVGISIYMALYYIIVFNKYFDGIDGKMLKQSNLIKKVKRNVILVALGITCFTIVSTQNILFGDILKVNDDLTLTGAGGTEATIKLWGYLIFAVIIMISISRAVKAFSEGNSKKALKRLIIIPVYLILLFIVMLVYDLIFVNSNELDKEKQYLEYNIRNTKNAYNINIDEENIENTGTITSEEIAKNVDTIGNIAIVNKDTLLKTLKDTQTSTGYYSYNNANIQKYNIDGKEKLAYVAPREIANKGRTYNNKTYEYTHSMGLIFASATSATNTGGINYIQKNVSGADEVIDIKQPRMYFGKETNETVATNTKNKKEYDYTDETGKEYTSTYEGNAGLNLNFIDRLILGITKGDLNLAFSGEITDDSKILINRNIIERAKKALPQLIYDSNPYTVVTDDGKIKWVIDAYTVSSNYPYSQYTSIEHDYIKEKINYIRNSVKVIIDSYDGTISYYITDRTDPIIMAYRNTYPTLFKDLDENLPEDISKHIVYPEYLYNIQANMLNTYHNVKPDVLYRSDDLWDIAKTNTTTNTKSTGTPMEPYYTMVKTNDDKSDLGLVQMYTPNKKQNLISYLVGKTDGTTNKLKLYKFTEDSSIVGPMQLEKQISEDEAISQELGTVATTGSKVTKQMIIIPIDNTLLYVEPVYQTMLNESEVPVLKKVVVASGNKVAIGDNLEKALENLLSKYAVDIKVENTEDIEGLIQAIIKANKNLTESNNNNNWEMMGKDIQKIQELVNSLDKLKEEENKKKLEGQNNNTNNTNTTNTTTNQILNNTVNSTNTY